MNRKLIHQISVLVSALPFILYSHFSSAAKPTMINTCVMDSELFPLWRKPGQEKQQNPGLNIELYDVIIKKLDLQTSWVRAPFLRCLALLQNGEVDVINAVSYQQAREQFGRYPFYKGEIDVKKRLKFDSYHAFVYTTAETQWQDGHFIELGNQAVAIEIGASIKTLLSQQNIALIELPSAGHAFGMLKKQRVAAVVTNQNNGFKYADPLIKQLPEPVQTKAYYLMISNQFYSAHKELAEQIWAESEALHISESERITHKYNQMSPW
jgi:polar amino acid transport system substrate-binding protein